MYSFTSLSSGFGAYKTLNRIYLQTFVPYQLLHDWDRGVVKAKSQQGRPKVGYMVSKCQLLGPKACSEYGIQEIQRTLDDEISESPHYETLRPFRV